MKIVYIDACLFLIKADASVDETLAFYRIIEALPGQWKEIDAFLTAKAQELNPIALQGTPQPYPFESIPIVTPTLQQT